MGPTGPVAGPTLDPMTHAFEPTSSTPERGSHATWWWRLLDVRGEEVGSVPDLVGVGARFVSQGDAESWVGEHWRALLDGGVESVELHEVDRIVYGPMSLRPAT